MQGVETQSVPLPGPVEPGATDHEAAAAIVQVLAGLRDDGARSWSEIARRLEAAGWEVGWRIGWVADARRRGVHEQALGRSRDEAFARLLDLTLLDDVEGCP